jgi:hypothetical protein
MYSLLIGIEKRNHTLAAITWILSLLGSKFILMRLTMPVNVATNIFNNRQFHTLYVTHDRAKLSVSYTTFDIGMFFSSIDN